MNQKPIDLNDVSGYMPEPVVNNPLEEEMRAFLNQYSDMNTELNTRIALLKSRPTKKSSCRSATVAKRKAARKAKKTNRKK